MACKQNFFFRDFNEMKSFRSRENAASYRITDYILLSIRWLFRRLNCFEFIISTLHFQLNIKEIFSLILVSRAPPFFKCLTADQKDWNEVLCYHSRCFLAHNLRTRISRLENRKTRSARVSTQSFSRCQFLSKPLKLRVVGSNPSVFLLPFPSYLSTFFYFFHYVASLISKIYEIKFSSENKEYSWKAIQYLNEGS